MVPCLFWCPFGCLFSSAQRGIKTDGYQNSKFFEFGKLDILVPVCFGTPLGASSDFPFPATVVCQRVPVGGGPAQEAGGSLAGKGVLAGRGRGPC